MASEKQLNEAIDGLEIGLLGMRNREAGYIQRITQLEADLKTAEAERDRLLGLLGEIEKANGYDYPQLTEQGKFIARASNVKKILSRIDSMTAEICGTCSNHGGPKGSQTCPDCNPVCDCGGKGKVFGELVWINCPGCTTEGEKADA